MRDLYDKKVAILMTDGVELVEFEKPLEALKNENAKVQVVSIKSGSVKSWDKGNWAKEISVDKTVDEVDANDYDALVLPGGVINPDKLRTNEKAVRFVRDFFEQKKPVAAICHGPWTLINAGVADGKKMTSYKSLQKDLENAGATWMDKEVVVDQGLVTSRTPDDLPAFCKKMIEEIKEGVHQGQTV